MFSLELIFQADMPTEYLPRPPTKNTVPARTHGDGDKMIDK